MSDDDLRDRIEALFEAALELSPEERDAFVASSAGSDRVLLNGVQALLRAHERAGVLEQPLPTVRLPERVGAYRILDVLGRGGMGVVYLGERDDGHFRQRVAVKVIRSDEDPELPARMVAERQILATLDHPNIARLLDGGVTDDGRPYLVMEHVAGLPIDVYCDRMRLSVTERVRLFTTVARAVDHAHRNLIVHRDLKPSNILVTADGRPKLLDFGIAKLLNPSLAGVDAPLTRTERRALTPEYASPEQLRGEALTTTSDVYALGVVLYRLLAGLAPYEPKPTASAMLSQVLDDDPPRPSQRVIERRAAELDVDRAEIARDRNTTPERLHRMLRDDLDAIVLKALRREPARRYGSAELLAQDLDAWLRGDAVLAHRGSRWYRAQKLVRRHKASAIAAGVVAISLLLGAGSATWQASVARHERDRAERARAEAQNVTDFLLELFRASEGGDAEGEVTASALLGRGVARAEAMSGQPLVQARMLDVVGQAYYGLGRYSAAEELLRRAADLQRAGGEAAQADLAGTLVHLAWVLRAQAREDDARRLVREALDIRRANLPDDHPDLAETLFELGWGNELGEQERLYREAIGIYARRGDNPERRVAMMLELTTNLRRQGRTDEALENARAARALAEAELGSEHATTGRTMIHLADQERDLLGNIEEAERLYRRGLAIQERQLGDMSVELMHGINSLAHLESERHNHAQAEALLRRGLRIREAATGPHHPSVASSLGQIADVLSQAGRYDEALRYATSSYELYVGLLGETHPAVAASLGTLSRVHEAAGRPDTAIALLRRMVALRELRPDPIPIGQGYRALGLLLARRGHDDDAERALLRSEEVLADALGADHPNTQESRRALSRFYAERGRPELAERYEVPPGRFIPY